MACRDTNKAEQAASDIKKSMEGLPNLGQLIIRELDLTSFRSVRKCAEEILETEKSIHLLVNNAGELWFNFKNSSNISDVFFWV